MRFDLNRDLRQRQLRRGRVRNCIAVAGLLLPGTPALAEDVALVQRVEEDWELVLNTPSGELESPQFHTVMSPHSGTSGRFFQATWNYRDAETYLAGGMQVQELYGEELMQIKEVGQEPLSTTAETVSWTQSLELAGTSMKFTVFNGQSSSWGSFGGSSMQLTCSSYLTSLNNYNPNTSVKNSWITYGANRVNELRIKEVRYYDHWGLVWKDSSPKVVYKLSN